MWAQLKILSFQVRVNFRTNDRPQPSSPLMITAIMQQLNGKVHVQCGVTVIRVNVQCDVRGSTVGVSCGPSPVEFMFGVVLGQQGRCSVQCWVGRVDGWWAARPGVDVKCVALLQNQAESVRIYKIHLKSLFQNSQMRKQ